MEIIPLKKDIKVFYSDVPGFPNGIKEAFDELYQKGGGRDYYGISYMDEQGKVIYKAAAAEQYDGEGKELGFEKAMSIQKGDYLTLTYRNWMQAPHKIKDYFEQLMQDPRFDDTHPCVEWYKSDDEVWIMVKAATVPAW